MTQKELIKEVAADVNAAEKYQGGNKITEGTVKDVVDSFVKVTTAEVAKGEKIQLAGLGTFEMQEKPAREGRNPQTGEKMMIASKKVPKFKAAKAFKDVLNN